MESSKQRAEGVFVTGSIVGNYCEYPQADHFKSPEIPLKLHNAVSVAFDFTFPEP